MPRVGFNPMKRYGRPYEPKRITLVTTVFIPELTGYWEESLDVLKVCLESLFESTDLPYDLVVWDNGSCSEVRDYLSGLYVEGKIQFLFLSLENVSKIGCFNAVFPGAPGEYIGYFDSDVRFYPGWLNASVKVFETFDKVGVVTGRPARSASGDGTRKHYKSTMDYAEQAANGLRVERGDLIPADDLRDHFRSLGGIDDPDFKGIPEDDIRLTLGDVSVFVWASHFQFLTKRSVASEILPLSPGDRALGGADHRWSKEVNRRGYLRVSLDHVCVRHIGNSLADEDVSESHLRSYSKKRHASSTSTSDNKSLKRRAMLKAYKMLSKALYSNAGRRP